MYISCAPGSYRGDGDDHLRYFDCDLDNVLGILPGLRLDKLIVHGLTYYNHVGPQTDRAILHEMITNPHGWKELHYICSNSLVLANSGMRLPRAGRVRLQNTGRLYCGYEMRRIRIRRLLSSGRPGAMLSPEKCCRLQHHMPNVNCAPSVLPNWPTRNLPSLGAGK